MLAARRSFEVDGKSFATPMLVPSFSSRGFEDVAGLIRNFGQFFTGPTLVSAYDVEHSGVSQRKLSFTDLVFLDSGGYEKGGLPDMSEVPRDVYKKKPWTKPMHKAVLRKWNYSARSTVVVTYDNPASNQKIGLQEQLANANELAEGFSNASIDVLIKPGPGLVNDTFKEYLDTDLVVDQLEKFAEFSIIGVTEKELGRTIIDRMCAIARMRQRLDELGKSTPIHIFGSLDPISSSLYFVSGADIFDGLTWLRYGYWKGVAVYRHNFAAHKEMMEADEEMLNSSLAIENLIGINALKYQLERFYPNRDFSQFDENKDVIEKAAMVLKSRMEA